MINDLLRPDSIKFNSYIAILLLMNNSHEYTLNKQVDLEP